MKVDLHTDASEFAAFAHAIRGDRIRSERVVRRALRLARLRPGGTTAEDLSAVATAFDGTLGTLDRATEELRIQNEELFAARTELESTSAFFRDLFELAPAAYLVTTTTTQIRYANDAACLLLRRRKNALAGKPLICFVPLQDRSDFRSAVLRATSAATISQWSFSLMATGSTEKLQLRARVKVVSSLTCERSLYWNILEEPDEDLF